MGFFSAVKKLFAGDAAPGEAQASDGREPSVAPEAASAEEVSKARPTTKPPWPCVGPSPGFRPGWP